MTMTERRRPSKGNGNGRSISSSREELQKRAKNLTKNKERKEERGKEERKKIHSSSPTNPHEKVENPRRGGGKPSQRS
jgi:hypothetical protein